MNGNFAVTSYFCQDDIYWVKDEGQIILVAESRHCTFVLQGLEEAVWSWLTLGYRPHQIQRQISAMLGTTDFEARTKLLQLLDDWVEKGIIRKSEA